MELHEKQAFRRICYSKLMILALIVVALFLAKGTWGVYKKVSETDQERDLASARLTELQRREKVISTDVSALGSDAGLEQALREKFGVVAPGESVVVIVDAPPATSTAATSTPGFFGKVWGAVWDFF